MDAAADELLALKYRFDGRPEFLTDICLQYVSLGPGLKRMGHDGRVVAGRHKKYACV